MAQDNNNNNNNNTTTIQLGWADCPPRMVVVVGGVAPFQYRPVGEPVGMEMVDRFRAAISILNRYKPRIAPDGQIWVD